MRSVGAGFGRATRSGQSIRLAAPPAAALSTQPATSPTMPLQGRIASPPAQTYMTSRGACRMASTAMASRSESGFGGMSGGVPHHHAHDHPSHRHGHAHGHAHGPPDFGRAFAIGIVLNMAYVAAEAV